MDPNDEFSKNQGNEECQSGTAATAGISAELTGWQLLFQMSRAKRIARPTSNILVRGRDVINGPIFPFATVCK